MCRVLITACAALALLTACPDTKVPQDPTKLPTPKALGGAR
ncbi:hypothetical protein [Pseudorhodoferax soli]|uniref:Lipoprotein n=1 Tax=Pseudorhodoferax soli TaxID=545864 RepID=A0A368Y6E3_9BURK|nr:hypothetical protein [Pseudorhodoferax soli]RCW75860.1 hypothetical protein DES41_101463 [Pseudorhodoferax soli]